MRIEQQRVGSVDVLMPVGALVDEDGEQFGDTLLTRLRTSNPRVVLAMQEVPYMDSAALEMLLEASDLLVERAASLKLAAVTSTCREILELTGLSDRFQFFNTMEDGVRSYL